MKYFASILIIGAVAGLGFIGLSKYVDVAYGQGTSGLLTAENKPGASTANGAIVIALLNKLSGITLDGSVLNTEAFKSLQDFSVSIPPQPFGRPNPYLPVSGMKTSEPVSTPKPSGPQFLR